MCAFRVKPFYIIQLQYNCDFVQGNLSNTVLRHTKYMLYNENKQIMYSKCTRNTPAWVRSNMYDAQVTCAKILYASYFGLVCVIVGDSLVVRKARKDPPGADAMTQRGGICVFRPTGNARRRTSADDEERVMTMVNNRSHSIRIEIREVESVARAKVSFLTGWNKDNVRLIKHFENI